MSQIDWSKAPEGATHYGRKCGDWHESWYIVDGDKICTMLDDGCDDEWDTRDIDAEDREELLPRLVARPVEWSGTGLPPVGVVCEMQDDVGRWIKVEIIASHAGFSHGWEASSEESFYSDRPEEFRPIRTPEQIAAALADQAIKEIAAIICRDGAFDIDDPEVAESAVALYDSGYRKQSTKQDGE